MLCTNDVVPVMFLTVVFIVGSPMYYKAKPPGNIMLDVCKCIGVSVVYTICINIAIHPALICENSCSRC